MARRRKHCSGCLGLEAAAMKDNPTQQQWMVAGAVALFGVAAYVFFRTPVKKEEVEVAVEPPGVTPSTAPAPKVNTAPVLLDFVVVPKNHCFDLEQMWEFSKTTPNHNLIYSDQAPAQWGVVKDQHKDVRYSSQTCKFYMWGFGQWVENASMQNAANAWAKGKGLS